MSSEHQPVYRVVQILDDGTEYVYDRPYSTLGAARNRKSRLQNIADYRTRDHGYPVKKYQIQATDGLWMTVE